jgi:hypothetical protein
MLFEKVTKRDVFGVCFSLLTLFVIFGFLVFLLYYDFVCTKENLKLFWESLQ